MTEVYKPFATIREACNITGLSQHYLRDGVKAGIIPHIKSGNTYMINVSLMMQQLDNMSMSNVLNGREQHGGESVNGELENNGSKKKSICGCGLRTIGVYEK